MIRKTLLFICTSLVLLCHTASAYRQEVVMVRSESMDKDVPVTVITQDSYDGGRDFPVVYILHGFSDNHLKWAEGGLAGRLADQYEVLAVLPDGGFSSWYFDSPVMPEYKYETFVSKELVSYIDENFETKADRSARAVTGNSMGGHGALYLTIRHQDVFGNAGSMSGGVDIRPFPDNWHISHRLGRIDEYPENWENNAVINLTHLLKPGFVNIIFDCGTEDFFYEVNCNLHKRLMEQSIPHEFHSRPGRHDWAYWRNAIEYQFLFFSQEFNKNR